MTSSRASSSSWTPEAEGAWAPPVSDAGALTEPVGSWPVVPGPVPPVGPGAAPAVTCGPGSAPAPPVGPGSLSSNAGTGLGDVAGGPRSPYSATGDAGSRGPVRRPGDVLMSDGRDLVDWVSDPVGTAVGHATSRWPRPLRWLAQLGVEIGGWVLRGRLLDLLLRR